MPRHYQLNSFTGKGLASIVVKSEEEVWPKNPDAILISASPDLLTALMDCMETIETYTEWHNENWPQSEKEQCKILTKNLKAARAAIKKATQP